VVSATVSKNGSDPSTSASNLLSTMDNLNRGAVLAEPFPWTVTQEVVLVLVIINSQLKNFGLGMPTVITTLEPRWVR
jgi:hypothetical protein